MTHQLQLEAQIGGYEAAEAAADQIDDTYRALGRAGRRIGATRSRCSTTPPTPGTPPSTRSRWRPGDRILTGRSRVRQQRARLPAGRAADRRRGGRRPRRRERPDRPRRAGRPRRRAHQADRAQLGADRGRSGQPGRRGRPDRPRRPARCSCSTPPRRSASSRSTSPTLGCDMLTGTGRKFLRGPRGTGFLWVAPRALDRLDPFVAEIRSATWDGGRGRSPGPTARSGSRPGRTATSTSSGSARRSARRSTSGWPRSASARSRSARGCASGSPRCPA